MSTYLWVGLGSALGGMGRFWCTDAVARVFGETFPWGTITVNVVGSFLIGFIATLTAPDGRLLVGTSARHFLMIGILGGYTTFSSFSLQTLALAREDMIKAGGNVVLSVVLCLVAVALGHVAAAGINQLKGS